MTLDDYHTEIGKHLQLIEAGAEMTARHARLMVQKPGFETKAQDEMDRAEQILERALERVRVAKAAYASKPVEHTHAA